MVDTTIREDHSYNKTFLLLWKASDPDRRWWVAINVKRMIEERTIWDENQANKRGY